MTFVLLGAIAWKPILIAFAVLAAIGALLGLMLAVASKVFYVETDERVEAIKECLPGANCGGCGYAGCGALAEAIVKGNAKSTACGAGGPKVAKKIAAIMGEESVDFVGVRAQVMCSGCSEKVKLKYHYEGLEDCRSAIRQGGGDKLCPNGCIGHGTCVKACVFDAIHVIDGVAVVDYEKCTGCGKCAEACPKSIIKLVPFKADVWVGCSSTDKGALTRTYCEVGCIGCKICEKNCPTGAVKVENGLARIDYDICTQCGICYEKCPRHIIFSGKEQKLSV